MSQVKVLIVEDEILIADNIADTLTDLGYCVFEPASSYNEAIESIEAEKPDIAILDIQMPGKRNGVDLAMAINENYHFPFIFLTSNSDKLTLEQAKKVEPLAYLVKPFNRKELYTSIELALYNYSKRAEKALNQENLVIRDALFIKQNKLFVRLDFKDIVYLKSDHIYIEIFTSSNDKYIVRGSLNEYINKLGPSFFRSHRSCIANLDYLKGIEHNSISIYEHQLPIGKKQRDELLSRLNRG